MKKDGNPNSETAIHHDYAYLMHTRLDIILWGVSANMARHISQEIIASGLNLQKVLDRFDPEAETYKVNHQAPYCETPASPLMIDILSKSIEYYKKTEGAFNVFAGKTYDEIKAGNTAEQTESEVNLPEHVHIDRDKQTIRFTSKEISLDFGGIGKGLALDKIAEILDQTPQINAFISFGGSSVLTRGHHPHGEFWPFSFREPGITDTWHLIDDALSVSQTRANKKIPPHVWNTFEGNVVTKNQMACVQSKSATEAEVLSTALLTLPEEKQEQIMKAFQIKKHKIYNLIA